MGGQQWEHLCFVPRLKLIGVVMFCGQILEVLPFLRTSCDLVVIIRQKLVSCTDAKITEGLTLTRDQMTASTDIFRMDLIVWSPCVVFLASTALFPMYLLGKDRERRDCLPLKEKSLMRQGILIFIVSWPVA